MNSTNKTKNIRFVLMDFFLNVSNTKFSDVFIILLKNIDLVIVRVCWFEHVLGNLASKLFQSDILESSNVLVSHFVGGVF